MLTQDEDMSVLARQPHPDSDENPTAGPKYILGHSTAEIRRLMKQAEILRPITARLLQAAGILGEYFQYASGRSFPPS